MSAALSFAAPRPLQLDVVGRTDTGMRRHSNEDAFAVDAALGLLVIADGMGGHAAGEVASRMTVEAITDLLRDPEEGWSTDAPLPPRAAGGVLIGAIQRANSAVWSAAQRVPELHGMGTTVVAALAFRGCLAVAHVGDSRAYLLRERWLARLTEDHTVGNARRQAGMRSRESDPFGNYWHALTRSVGSAATIEVETRFLTPRPGDVLLLCSDGLTNVVDDQEIAAIISAQADLSVATAELIDAANHRGGPDNVTVVLSRWP